MCERSLPITIIMYIVAGGSQKDPQSLTKLLLLLNVPNGAIFDSGEILCCTDLSIDLLDYVTGIGNGIT